MIKNLIIALLSLIILMFWIKVDPECVNPNEDPNLVVIEYLCSELSEYENVPPEVVEECKDRANKSINHKNNT